MIKRAPWKHAERDVVVFTHKKRDTYVMQYSGDQTIIDGRTRGLRRVTFSVMGSFRKGLETEATITVTTVASRDVESC